MIDSTDSIYTGPAKRREKMVDTTTGSSPRAAVILAAGKGTRMKSELPKVAVPLAGKPMLLHVIENLVSAGLRELIIVVGYKKEDVISLVPEIPDVRITFAEQVEQKGTAHALLCAEPALSGFSGRLLVACGDMPLIRSTTFSNLFGIHEKEKHKVTILSAILENPKGYGRLVRNGNGNIVSIIEEKDASDEIRSIRETNTGTYIFEAPEIFHVLKHVDSDNAQKEYYLPDAVSIIRSSGGSVGSLSLADAYEAMGANSKEDLEVLEEKYAAFSR